MEELLARAHAELTGEDVAEALAGHPRLGEPPAARQSSRSRSEQAGVDGADGTVRAELAAGNRRLRGRFGHIYLVCASGRSAQELLSILRDRLGNDPATERQVVRAELGKINDLRLARLMGARERASLARSARTCWTPRGDGPRRAYRCGSNGRPAGGAGRGGDRRRRSGPRAGAGRPAAGTTAWCSTPAPTSPGPGSGPSTPRSRSASH